MTFAYTSGVQNAVVEIKDPTPPILPLRQQGVQTELEETQMTPKEMPLLCHMVAVQKGRNTAPPNQSILRRVAAMRRRTATEIAMTMIFCLKLTRQRQESRDPLVVQKGINTLMPN